jgi:hypothetical protein
MKANLMDNESHYIRGNKDHPVIKVFVRQGHHAGQRAIRLKATLKHVGPHRIG